MMLFCRYLSPRQALLAVFAAFFLVGCDPVQSETVIDSNPVNPSPSSQNVLGAGTLLINEVGSSYFSNTMRWFELYNPGGTAVDLSDYQLRSPAYDGDSSVANSLTFNLPSTTVNSGQYLIVRAQSLSSPAVDTSRVVHLEQGGWYPYWTSQGYLELLDAATGASVDFVTFDTSFSPTDASAWSGGAALALVSSETSFGQSIGRNGTSVDTNTGNDWSHSGWATIGGPNDVLCNTDADGDLIPDCNEQSGTTFAGMPLYDWGARSGKPDIFIEVDYMNSADEGVIPRQEALQSVVNAFAAQGISVHFDVGDLFDGAAGLNPAKMDLGGGGQVPFALGMTFGDVADMANLYHYKRDYMAYNRLPVFHYMVFAYTQDKDGNAGSSGLAELVGNDILITLGAVGLNSGSTADRNLLINFQAGTVMHELGHNLGLRHGGDENTNDKPNYLSVMNYLYQLNGLPLIGSDEGDRYYYSSSYYEADPTCYSGLNQGPDQSYTGFRLDYSDGSAIDLDIAALNENLGLGEVGSGKVDFNCNGTDSETSVSKASSGTWSDHDDWGNLQLDFGGYDLLSNQGFSLRSFQQQRSESLLRLPDPVGDDRSPIAEETPRLFDTVPSAYFLRQQQRPSQP
ncbi:zinc-dependent metalloprotease family protein [Saccharospirillum sp. HFRX-1]|uniref:lamin tail domain-containing protein n=1 Tax=unclassified Saccharospirillum TaxID=2633430 RepID=UPI00371F665C